MENEDIKFDDTGVPLLDTPVDLARIATSQPETAPDLTDQQQIETLLHDTYIKQILDDLAEDLQKSITVKIETSLKEEITRLVHQAAEQSAPKIAEDIHTHLELAIPELLAEICKRAKG